MTTRLSAVILFAYASIALSMAQMASPDATYLSGQVVTSPYFRFSFRVPSNLTPNTGEVQRQMMKQGRLPSTSTAVLLFAAYEPPSPARSRQGVIIVARSEGRTTAKDYADQRERSLKANGWTVLRSSEKVLIGEHEFYRLDYSHAGGYQGAGYTAMKGYLLEFLFTGGTEDDIRTLFMSLNTLRFDVGATH